MPYACKESQIIYNHSEQGRARIRKYLKSAKGRAAHKKYVQSKKGRVSNNTRCKRWRKRHFRKVRAYRQLERVKAKQYFHQKEYRRKWQPTIEQLAHRL